MLSDTYHKAERFRYRFLLQLCAPLIAVIVLITVTGYQAIRWAAKDSDMVSLAQQQSMANVALIQAISNLGAEQRSVALWRPLAVHLQRSPDERGFLDENIGEWLHKMFGHDATYLLRPDGQAIYANVGGRPRPASDYADVQADVSKLLRTLQDEARAIGTRAGPSSGGEADGNSSPPVHQIQGMVAVQGRPTFASVSYIAADPEGEPRTSRSPWPTPVNAALGKPPAGIAGQFIIVSLLTLDDDFLRDLSRQAGFENLRYVPDDAVTRDGEGALPLHAFDGAPLGKLVWQARVPGTEMAESLVPSALLTLAIIITLLVVLMIVQWRSARQLYQAMRELRASEAHSQYLAFHDVLTGLPNRAFFDERFAQTLASALKAERRVALLLIDLDRFKEVNDTMGHHAGDALIRAVALRLKEQLGDTDMVARLGGDEFVVVLDDVDNATVANRRCEQLQAALRKPIDLLGNRILPAATVGYVLAPDDGTERSELMRRADIALYAAKNAGRGVSRRFDKQMDDTVQLRNLIASDLRAAMESGDGLSVHYQPEVDRTGRKVVGLEALLRWRHPSRGDIRPDQFIPVAEETGLIVPLGEWVFRCACRTATRWPNLFIAVNVSPVQFRSAGFAESLVTIAAAEGCHPGCIELEITEGVLLEDAERAQATLSTLREAGFKIALDDFGTGYSSLHYLRHLPVDKIKIDRSFTQSLGSTTDALAIIDSVVGLGKAMRLTVTAEGVETSAQMSALVAVGCSELQGYLFSRPIPEHELDDAIQAVERGDKDCEIAI